MKNKTLTLRLRAEGVTKPLQSMSASIILIMCVAVFAIILLVMFFSYNNKEIALRKEAEAQRGKIKSVRDKVFKIIREKANVSTEYRKAFEKIYPDLIAGRYSGDNGGMMKWIQEQNPTFDTSLYGDLMQSIEVQREAFNTEQTRMLDIINQRAALLEQYPSCWFIRNKSAIDYTVIASTSTNNIMQTGIDDEMLTFHD